MYEKVQSQKHLVKCKDGGGVFKVAVLAAMILALACFVSCSNNSDDGSSGGSGSGSGGNGGTQQGGSSSNIVLTDYIICEQLVKDGKMERSEGSYDNSEYKYVTVYTDSNSYRYYFLDDEGNKIKDDYALDTYTIDSKYTEIDIKEVPIKSLKIPAGVKKISSVPNEIETIEFEENSQLEEIYAAGFYGCDKLKTLDIPASIKKIEIRTRVSYGGSFPSDMTLIIRATTPPKVYDNSGEEEEPFIRNKRTYVPAESVAAYQNSGFSSVYAIGTIAVYSIPYDIGNEYSLALLFNKDNTFMVFYTTQDRENKTYNFAKGTYTGDPTKDGDIGFTVTDYVDFNDLSNNKTETWKGTGIDAQTVTVTNGEGNFNVGLDSATKFERYDYFSHSDDNE